MKFSVAYSNESKALVLAWKGVEAIFSLVLPVAKGCRHDAFSFGGNPMPLTRYV